MRKGVPCRIRHLGVGHDECRVSSSHAATTMAATIAATMAAPASSQLQPPHPAAGAPAFCGAPLRLWRPTRARGARTSPCRDRADPRPSSHSCERAHPPGCDPRSTSSAAATPSGRSSRGCRHRRRCRRRSRPSICPSRVCPWGQKTRAADAPGPRPLAPFLAAKPAAHRVISPSVGG